jgi:hypothetical protein
MRDRLHRNSYQKGTRSSEATSDFSGIAILLPCARLCSITGKHGLSAWCYQRFTNPDLIPDVVALRLVLASFRTSTAVTEDQVQKSKMKQELRLQHMKLSDADKAVFRTAMSTIDTWLTDWETKTTAAITSGQVFVISPDVERDAVVMRSRDLLKAQLSPEAWKTFSHYVHDAKRSMVVWP